jgi:hypothetical protein
MAPSRASALARKGDRLLSTQELCALYRCHKATIQRRMPLSLSQGDDTEANEKRS